MDIQLKKGLLEGCILASLKMEESYGYKIISDISPYITISESTLYPILRRLETAGCLKTKLRHFNGRLRKYYYITEAGKRKLQEFYHDMDEMIRIYEYICRSKSI